MRSTRTNKNQTTRKETFMNILQSRPAVWRALCACGAFGMVAALAAPDAHGQERFPARTIQVVIGYAPGAQDNIIRPFQEKLSDYYKQPVVFTYKPGAGGAVGAAFVAKSRPDGYTLFVSSAGPVILNPLTKEGLEYKLGDLIPVARVASLPLGLAVKSTSPFKTLKDVVDAARANPGKISFSTSGASSTPDLLMQLFQRAAKVSLQHIPYNGTAPAVVALMGGHVDMAGAPLYGVDAFYRAGQARVLAVGERTRGRDHADVPTFTELGYPVVFAAWHGIFAPRGTPPEVIANLSGALKKVVDDNRSYFEEKMKTLSVTLDMAGTDEFAAAVRTETEAMRGVAAPDKAPAK